MRIQICKTESQGRLKIQSSQLQTQNFYLKIFQNSKFVIRNKDLTLQSAKMALFFLINNHMEVKDRIKLLMDSVKMSQQEFAKVLGITPGSLSGILNERTRPTNNHTLAIHKAFPNISINWLLFGEGEMYKDVLQEEHQEINEGPESSTSLFEHEGNSSQALNLFSRDVRNDNVNNVDFTEPQRADSPIIIKRCVKEIRIFYDDGTYESFVSSEK